MGNQVKVENSNEILRKDYDNDLVEVWQKFTLIPKPDLDGKTLNCSYVQVKLTLTNFCVSDHSITTRKTRLAKFTHTRLSATLDEQQCLAHTGKV